MANTKVYGTIGPACCQTDILFSMAQNGMDGLRINLSHGNLAMYKEWIENIRKVEKELQRTTPIIADIQGPEIRTGTLPNHHMQLSPNERIILSPDKAADDEKRITITYPHLAKEVVPGNHILIDDGSIRLAVESISQDKIACIVLEGGMLGERKGVNVPGVHLNLPSLTPKDMADIQLGISLGIDSIMLPFTRNLQDVLHLRTYLKEHGGSSLGILAKIENQSGIDHLEDFIEEVEGIVIARGDLGVEIPLEKVPLYQKEMVQFCREKRKMSIVVTHMLHSMTYSPHPTRAEISDIANAVIDGAQGVMLTGETAEGKYPAKAIQIMHKVVEETELWLKAGGIRQKP